MITKSLLLPDNHKGLTDSSKRQRCRHLDFIVNPNVKSTFIKRLKAASSMRALLDVKQELIEAEIPALHSAARGTEAKLFETHNNLMGMDLTSHISTELYFKRDYRFQGKSVSFS